MTGPQIMERMARNNAWANSRLHGAVSALPPGAFIAPRSGFFPSIRQTMTHILDVDRYYLAALGLFRFPAPAPRTLEALTDAQTGLDGVLIDFCADLAPDDLAGIVATDRSDGVVEEVLGELLMHLFQHQIHHRGQIHAMLSDAGAHLPQLDEFFLGFERHPTAAAFDAR